MTYKTRKDSLYLCGSPIDIELATYSIPTTGGKRRPCRGRKVVRLRVCERVHPLGEGQPSHMISQSNTFAVEQGLESRQGVRIERR